MLLGVVWRSSVVKRLLGPAFDYSYRKASAGKTFAADHEG